MSKKEREICELEMDFKKFFLLYHMLHVKFCPKKWVINLSFRSRENLFLVLLIISVRQVLLFPWKY